MNTETTARHLRRNYEEIIDRIDALDGDDLYYGHRLEALEQVLFGQTHDVRQEARLHTQMMLFLPEAHVGPYVAHLRELVWLLGRDDVITETDRALAERGAGWPEIWAIATLLDSHTTEHWAKAVAAYPEVAEWAAGLPVPTGREPF